MTDISYKAQHQIEAANYDILGDNSFNCSLNFDEALLIYCKNDVTGKNALIFGRSSVP